MSSASLSLANSLGSSRVNLGIDGVGPLYVLYVLLGSGTDEVNPSCGEKGSASALSLPGRCWGVITDRDTLSY